MESSNYRPSRDRLRETIKNIFKKKSNRVDEAKSLEVNIESQLTAILCLPYYPDAVSYRPYLDNIASVTILEWFLEQYALFNPNVSLNILAYGGNIPSALERIIQTHRLTTILSKQKSQLQTFREVAVRSQTAHIAFFSLEFGFSPSQLLAKAFRHHINHGNNFTFINGIPEEGGLELYESDFLQLICNSQIPNIQQTPRSIINYLSAIAKENYQRTSSLPNIQRLLINLISKSVTVSRISNSSVPFDVLNIYGGDRWEMPESIWLDTPYQMSIAREVINRQSVDATTSDSLSRLMLWKKVALEKQQATRKELIGSATPIKHFPVNRERKRILFVSYPSGYSGAEESLCQLIGNIDPQQYERFALIGFSGRLTARLQKFGVSVISQEQDFSATTVNNFLFVISVINEVRPDIIHINSASGMPIILAAKLFNLPIIHHLRVPNLDNYGEFLKNSDAILTVSNFIRNEALKKDIDKNKVHVIYNGVDTDRFTPHQFDKRTVRKEFGLPADAKIVLNIARFAPNKRYDLLISASAIVRKLVPNAHLVLVGEPEDQQYYRSIVQQISELGLENMVTFLDFQHDIRKIETVADALVLCSDREPCGRCIIEAMAIGTPAIVTDSGGTHELIRHKVTGLITPGGNANELAQNIIELLTNKELSNNISRAARTFAETELSIKRHVEQVTQIYEKVMTKEKTNTLQHSAISLIKS